MGKHMNNEIETGGFQGYIGFRFFCWLLVGNEGMVQRMETTILLEIAPNPKP